MANKFYTRFQHSKLEPFQFTEPSLTQQSFAYECDINNIVNAMAVSNVNQNPPRFGVEFSPNQYEEALNIVASARSQFEELPSNIRNRFENDPKKLIEFMNKTDEASITEGVSLGLYDKKALDIFLKPTVEAEKPTETKASS